MTKGRLEAFSDGVIAILITIMVLEMKVPHASANLAELRPMLPVFLSYVLSFVYVGIYWNNHHHLLYATQRISGGVLWANLHLLFWLSLIPFTTGWMGDNPLAPAPMALYGIVLLMAGVGYTILEKMIFRLSDADSILGRALRKDYKGKLSLVIYLAAIGLSFIEAWVAGVLYVLVALMWLIPDPRIERAIAEVAPPRNRS